jgi:hypothetical protein
MLAGSLHIMLPFQLDGTTMCYSTHLLCFDILVEMWLIISNSSTTVIDVDVLIIYYQGLARLSCSGNINSAQTKTIPAMIAMTSILDFQSRTRICL